MLLVVILAVGEYRDGLFGIVLVANTLIGIVQELRAKRSLDRLAVLNQPALRWCRDGEETEVAVDRAGARRPRRAPTLGDQIAVDGEILAASGLEIDESLLTGEAEPVVKEPGDEVHVRQLRRRRQRPHPGHRRRHRGLRLQAQRATPAASRW